MKNKRTVGNRETILLYHFRDTEIGRQLSVITARMGVVCKVIEEEEVDETLGALLKLPGFQRASEANKVFSGAGVGGDKGFAGAGNGKMSMEEIARQAMEALGEKNGDFMPWISEQKKEKLPRQAMVMYGFTQSRLNEFLESMRKAELPKIPLKAIVTQYNINWTFRGLYEELEKEEASFQK